MKFIAESIIDKVAENGNLEKSLQSLQKEQPVLFAYLFTEDFKFLEDNEKDFFLYLSMVIWESFSDENKLLNAVNKASIESVEEKNWALLNASNEKKFRDRITPFFKNYTQEDLLAFIEDSLELDDEENMLTKEGRELLFIGLKTFLDALIDAVQE